MQAYLQRMENSAPALTDTELRKNLDSFIADLARPLLVDEFIFHREQSDPFFELRYKEKISLKLASYELFLFNWQRKIITK